MNVFKCDHRAFVRHPPSSQPWYHWKSRGTDITQCLSDEQLKLFTELDYLTPAQWNPLGGLGSAEQLEQDIRTGLIYSWLQQRCENDFKKTDGQYKPEPANVHRWMAHLLLTTTINIATGSKVVAFATTEDNKFLPAGSLPLRAPLDLFMNSELLLQDTFSDFNLAHFKLRNAICQNIYGLPKFIASTSDEFQARSKILPDANENSLGTFLVPPVESSNDCGPSTTNELLCYTFAGTASLNRYPSVSQAQQKSHIAESKKEVGAFHFYCPRSNKK
ncbi:hypothetical protein APSETT445_004993 [Aspergillus pseudonomiae]